jgi:hypothetical protein
VDIYHNGEKVGDEKRKLVNEVFGASAEKIDLVVKEGDWLVFNVVNNRLRWNGAYYFAVGGVKEDGSQGFASELGSGRWSVCDNPSDVNRFISDAGYLSKNPARPVERPWQYGDDLMKGMVKGWDGSAIWGTNRNTWIKFRALPVARN